jgi:hypothetical protein
MFLQITATPTSASALGRGSCSGLRQWGVVLLQGFCRLPLIGLVLLAMVLLALLAAATVLFFKQLV